MLCLSLLLSTTSYGDPFYLEEEKQSVEHIQEKITPEQEPQQSKQDKFFEPIENAEITSVPLKYAQAKDIFEAFTQGNGSILDGGYIHFDKQTNKIILKGDKKTVKKLVHLIKKLDQPIKQVAIEARIVTISSENLEELGVRWGMFNKGESTHQFAGKLEGNGFVY